MFAPYQDAVIEEDAIRTGWPCCRSGTLVLRAEIDRGGFKQGDDINLSLLVTNETSRDVKYTEVSLVQRTLFVAVEGKTDYSQNKAENQWLQHTAHILKLDLIRKAVQF